MNVDFGHDAKRYHATRLVHLVLSLSLFCATACARNDAVREPTLATYDRIATSRSSTAAERARSLIAGAQYCLRNGDHLCARLRLEQAVSLAVPAESEIACFHLAELLRAEDRPRAMNLYYQAAAGAERNLGGGFPYAEAMNRIAELGGERR